MTVLCRTARVVGVTARRSNYYPAAWNPLQVTTMSLQMHVPGFNSIQAMGMAGHSKWHNIRHKKGAEDAKKAILYSRIGKQLKSALDRGGNSPNNSELASVLAKAKELKVPKDVTDRAIARAMQSAAGGDQTYEGMGPAGISVIVQCVTDNKSRTASKLREIFKNYDCTLGTSNSVAFRFRRVGRIEIAALAADKAEEIIEKAIELGADDVNETGEDGLVITCTPEDLKPLTRGLKDIGVETASEELAWDPLEKIEVPEDKIADVQGFIEDLEGYDETDVLFHNTAW